jgi:hypothetical protein
MYVTGFQSGSGVARLGLELGIASKGIFCLSCVFFLRGTEIHYITRYDSPPSNHSIRHHPTSSRNLRQILDLLRGSSIGNSRHVVRSEAPKS